MTHGPWLPRAAVVPGSGRVHTLIEMLNCQLFGMQTAKGNSQQQAHQDKQ
jgi:hypothetical protein